MADIEEIIARAIKQADKSFFNENYRKQARAVLETLKKEGFAIAYLPPSESMIKAGVDALPAGRVKPEAVVERIYLAMAKSK